MNFNEIQKQILQPKKFAVLHELVLSLIIRAYFPNKSGSNYFKTVKLNSPKMTGWECLVARQKGFY